MKLLSIFFIICPPLIIQSQVIKHGTCIVGHKTKNKIFIGADSKMTILNYAGNNRMDTTVGSPVCKLHVANNFYYGISGILSYTSNELLKDICKGVKSIDEVFPLFEIRIQSYLSDTLNFIKKNDTASFTHFITQTNPLQLIIGHFEQDTAKLFVLFADFFPDGTGSFQLRWGHGYGSSFVIGEKNSMEEKSIIPFYKTTSSVFSS